MLLRNKKTKYANAETRVQASRLSYDKPVARRYHSRKAVAKTNVKKKEIVYEPPEDDEPLYRTPGIEYVYLAFFIMFVAVWVHVTMPLKDAVLLPPPPPPVPVGRASPWWPLVKEAGRVLSAHTGVGM